MSERAEIHIRDEVGFFGVTDTDFARELAAVGKVPISLYINSPGGSVFAGIAIHNQLARHPAPVHVFVDGVAASIASVIAMAGRTVTMGRGSEMMIHDPSGVCMGNADDMRQMADILRRVAGDIAGIYTDKAGGQPADWRAAMKKETWYAAQEAVDAGLADKVAAAATTDEVTASASRSAAVWTAGLSAQDVAVLGPWAAWSADYTVREERRARASVGGRGRPPSPRSVRTSTLADGRERRQIGAGLVVITGRTS